MTYRIQCKSDSGSWFTYYPPDQEVPRVVATQLDQQQAEHLARYYSECVGVEFRAIANDFQLLQYLEKRFEECGEITRSHQDAVRLMQMHYLYLNKVFGCLPDHEGSLQVKRVITYLENEIHRLVGLSLELKREIEEVVRYGCQEIEDLESTRK
jgi:hypothetical protein